MKYRVNDMKAGRLQLEGWTLVLAETTAFTEKLENYGKIDVLFQSGGIAKNCIPNTDVSDHAVLVARNWSTDISIPGHTIIAWKLSVK